VGNRVCSSAAATLLAPTYPIDAHPADAERLAMAVAPSTLRFQRH
jgi:hypothetical protein